MTVLQHSVAGSQEREREGRRETIVGTANNVRMLNNGLCIMCVRNILISENLCEDCLIFHKVGIVCIVAVWRNGPHVMVECEVMRVGS